MNLCTTHWVCTKADFQQKLSSETKEGKTKCQSLEVTCFITYQQLLQGVYCSGKSSFEASFWKECEQFGKSTEIAGPLLYMNVLWASQKMIYKEGIVLKLHVDFTYISKGGFNSVTLVSAIWNVCMCCCCSRMDIGTSTEEMFIKCINALTFANCLVNGLSTVL